MIQKKKNIRQAKLIAVFSLLSDLRKYSEHSDGQIRLITVILHSSFASLEAPCSEYLRFTLLDGG